MEEKYGIVYIWHDRKHKRYYIGSHWGTEDDGYICSSRWMRNSYKRRKEDFRRRTLEKVFTNRKELLEAEYKWLQKINDDEIGIKYYNLTKHLNGHWSTDQGRRLTVGQKISAAPDRRKNISKAMKGKKPSKANIEARMTVMVGRKQTDEEIQRRVKSREWYVHSEETKQKLRKPQPQITCPYCNKVGGISVMARWHFDNCKYK